MNYHHLSIEERSCIRKYYVDGLSYREIARLVGRNVSTISREIRRNCTQRRDSVSPVSTACPGIPCTPLTFSCFWAAPCSPGLSPCCSAWRCFSSPPTCSSGRRSGGASAPSGRRTPAIWGGFAAISDGDEPFRCPAPPAPAGTAPPTGRSQ